MVFDLYFKRIQKIVSKLPELSKERDLYALKDAAVQLQYEAADLLNKVDAEMNPRRHSNRRSKSE